jgi:hypothetical protein
MTRLRWLTTGPVEASPAGIRAEVTKLEFLRCLGANRLDLSVLPAERRRFLAAVGRRLTGQALERREPQRRYPILLTLVAQSGTDVLDEVVSLFDQAISAREGKAERTMRDALAERGKAGEDRQGLLDDLLAIIADTTIADEDIGSVIRGERIGWPRIRAAMAQAVPRLPRDHGHLGALDTSSYGYLRQFTPQVLAAVEFAGGTAAAELLAAVDIPARTQRHRRPPGPGRRPDGVRTHPLARLPRHGPYGGQLQRLPRALEPTGGAMVGQIRARRPASAPTSRSSRGTRASPAPVCP